MIKTTEEGIDAYQRLREHEYPPHLMPQLSKVLTGEQELTPEILSQVINHLHSCNDCQLAIEIMVADTLEQNDESASTEIIESIWQQLERLTAIDQSFQELDEHIANYAELLETCGEEEASERYSAFAVHLKYCLACSARVEDTQQALREAVSAGLIPPLDYYITEGEK